MSNDIVQQSVSISLQQTQQRVEAFNAIDDTMYRLVVKERDRERIINAELKLKIERLEKLLCEKGINSWQD